MHHGENLDARRFLKILFVLSQCKIPRAKGSGDLLPHSPVHVGAWYGYAYGSGAAARGIETLGRIDMSFSGGRWVIYTGKPNQHRVVFVIQTIRFLYLADLELNSPKK